MRIGDQANPNPLDEKPESAPDLFAPLEIRNCESPANAIRLLSKYLFYFSIFAYLYAVLFPFRFDFSWNHLSTAWSGVVFVPLWNRHQGFRIVPDDIANILLTVPLGFAGFLYCGSRSYRVFRWWILGLCFGLAAEAVQLAIPTRASSLSDAITNSLGAVLGAAVALAVGRRTLEFLTGTAAERRNIYLWMMIWCIVAMLGPYEVGPDYASHFHSPWLIFRNEPGSSGSLYGEEWLQMAGFALIGALAVRLAVPGRRKRTVRQPASAAVLVLVFPVVMHLARFLIGSRPPSINELALNLFGALAGAFVSLFIPPAMQALSGFAFFTLALIVAGLSPYSFSAWGKTIPFQWIPFYEFCANRSTSSLYEPVLSLVSFAILGGFLRLSFPRWRQLHIALYSVAFATAIEFVQTFLPSRTAGTGDILLAGMGAWAGAYVCASVQSARLNDRLFLNRTQEFSNYVM
jgi:glycopeptide antibiotics resistance protein